jgi:hypothetical protein
MQNYKSEKEETGYALKTNLLLKSITSELPMDLVDDKALESKIQSQVPTEKNPDSQDPRRLKNPPTPPPYSNRI